MTVCNICGGKNFSLSVGRLYCDVCGVESQNYQHCEENEENTVTQVDRSLKIRSLPTDKQKKKKVELDIGVPWITSEAFNIIINRQVNALIKLGASQKLKDAVLQIWSFYLQKCEIAFMEEGFSDLWLPALASIPRKRDVQVLCGEKVIKDRYKKFKKEKRTKKGTVSENIKDRVKLTSKSVEVDQAESHLVNVPSVNKPSFSPVQKVKNFKKSSYARKIQRVYDVKTLKKLTNKHRVCDYMCISKTLCFLYLGLLFTHDYWLLSDIIRYVKQGVIPYMDATHHLPSNMALFSDDWALLTPIKPPSMKFVVDNAAALVKFLNLPKIPDQSLFHIVSHFIKKLNLPVSLLAIVQMLISTYPPVKYHVKSTFIPLFEVQAMAYIMIVLKLLFKFDGKTERKLSKRAREKNMQAKKNYFFVWEEWLTYIKLKDEFLKSRDVLTGPDYSSILDVDIFCNFYHTNLHKWNHRESIRKRRDKFRHLDHRNALKKPFSDILAMRNDCPNAFQAINSAGTGKFASQCDLLRSSHQYRKSIDLNMSGLWIDFSAHSLSYIFDHWITELKSVKKCELRCVKKSKNRIGLGKLKGRTLASAATKVSVEQESKCESSLIYDSTNLEVILKTCKKSGIASKENAAKRSLFEATEKPESTAPEIVRAEFSQFCTSTEDKLECESVKQVVKRKGSKRKRADSDGKSLKKSFKGKVKRKKIEETKAKKQKSKKKLHLKNKSKGKDEDIKSTSKRPISKHKQKNCLQKSKKGKKSLDVPYWVLESLFEKSDMHEAGQFLPQDYEWLMEFVSSMIEVNSQDIYEEILRIEKRMFKC